jgi:hypothetical protein
MRAHTFTVAWLIVLGALLDVGVCMIWARPLLPFLIGGAALMRYAGPRSGAVTATARDFTRPLLTALTIVCLALVGLNSFYGVVNSATVQSAQDDLAQLRFDFDNIFALPLWLVLVVAGLLLVLAVVRTRLNAVEHFELVWALVGFIQILLFFLCTFGISQVPLQQQVDRVHGRAAGAYHAALKQELSSDAYIAAAKSLKASVKSLTPSQRARLATSLSNLDHALQHPSASGSEIEAALETDARAVPDVVTPLDVPVALSPQESRLIDPAPASSRQLTEQDAATRARQAGGTRAQQAARQAAQVAVFVLSRFMEQFIPIPIHTALAEMIGADLLDQAAAKVEPQIQRAFMTAEEDGARESADPATVHVPGAKLPTAEQPADIQSRFLEALKTTTSALEQPPGSGPPSGGPAREPSEIKDVLDEAVRANSDPIDNEAQ